MELCLQTNAPGGSVHEHIKPLRLFDVVQAEFKKSEFRLEPWEIDHLPGCEECTEMLRIFTRQFNPRRKNGERNTRPGVYKNLCCGVQIVIPDGAIFPDCQNHVNLPTEWKFISEVQKYGT